MDHPGMSLPDWAFDMVDLHAHAAPSLLPRHGNDAPDRRRRARRRLRHRRAQVARGLHRGACRAPPSDGVYGGVVLNSPMGGANPDAVEVAARLGGRVVWMPTVSSRTHKAGATSPELNVHQGFELRLVEVFDGDRLLPDWHDVLDVVAAHDLVLASGHLAADETVLLFREATAPRRAPAAGEPPQDAVPAAGMMRPPRELRTLGAHLELGILPDLLGPRRADQPRTARRVPARAAGVRRRPRPRPLPRARHGRPAPGCAASNDGSASTPPHAIMTTNGRKLLLP